LAQKHTPDNLGVAFFLNLGFALLEIAGGLWTNSMAIIADAIHDLGDSFSLGMAWVLDRYARKDQDYQYSYGYRRYSLLGALLNTFVLIGGGFIVLYEVIPRLIAPEPTYAPGMIAFAIAGIVVNGLAVLRLKGARSLNARVVIWHLFEDVLGWVAVLVISLILLFTDLYILDPILSILITFYILYNVINNLKETLSLFLQAVPQDINLDQLKNEILTIERVQSTHHTHVWSLDGEHHVLTTHVVIGDEACRDDVLQVKKEVIALTKGWNFEHVTLEIEYEGEDCRMQ